LALIVGLDSHVLFLNDFLIDCHVLILSDFCLVDRIDQAHGENGPGSHGLGAPRFLGELQPKFDCEASLILVEEKIVCLNLEIISSTARLKH
jgi:hypothetical protein